MKLWAIVSRHMRYHLYKATRCYSGVPYQGASSDHKPAQAGTLEEALVMRDLMTVKNSVGWIIHDTVANQDVPASAKCS